MSVDLVIVGPETKRCTKCGESKPNTNEYFHINKTTDQGTVLRPDCAICARKRNRERYHGIVESKKAKWAKENTRERSMKLRSARNAALTRLTRLKKAQYEVLYAQELKKRGLVLDRYDGLQFTDDYDEIYQ